jgi:hypothetical protein
MENEGMELDIIINPKVTDDGQSVIQVRCMISHIPWRFIQLFSLRLLPVLPLNTSRTHMESMFLANASSL